MADMNPPDIQQKRRKGRKPGLPNYHYNKLIPIIEHILPNGSELWHLVTITYKEESGKDALWTEDII